MAWGRQPELNIGAVSAAHWCSTAIHNSAARVAKAAAHRMTRCSSDVPSSAGAMIWQ